MKLGVFSPVFSGKTLDEALAYLHGLGVEQMELGCGGSPGTAHADVKVFSKDKSELEKIKETFKRNEMTVSALSVHGNAIHPDKAIADLAKTELVAAIKSAKKLGTDRVVTFSGCAGDKTSTAPNWVTCSWPTDFANLLEWQWSEKLIPFWKEIANIAEGEGVKVCLEMHPGFMVYNAETMLKLRNEVGKSIGANLDPSHLIWQGCSIPDVIYKLRDAIHFFHAKDTQIINCNKNVNGVLDTKSYAKLLNRSWIFRAVGYGDADWKAIMSALVSVGYDGSISVEHEDILMSPMEGLKKAVEYLKTVIIKEANTTEAWWLD